MLDPKDRVNLVFHDEAVVSEGVPANFKSVIPGCQVSPLVKYCEYSHGRKWFAHRRLSEIGRNSGYLVIGLFGNPTNWYGADGTSTQPLSKVIPDLRRIMDVHSGLRLLFDYSWEGGLGEQFFIGVDAFISDLGIDPARAVMLVSNCGIEDRYRRYLRMNNREVKSSYRMIGMDMWLMYSGVELRHKLWPDLPESLVSEAELEIGRRSLRKRKFLSFNRRPRWQRYLLGLMLSELGLEHEGFVSMSSPHYVGDWQSEHKLIEHFGRQLGSDLWHRLERVRAETFATLPWTIDIKMDENSGQPEQYLFGTQARGLFLESYCQVISESYMEAEANDVFITEKTCRAIGNLQPFIVLGHAGTLSTLQRHGFELGKFFNKEYDGIRDAGPRLALIYHELALMKQASMTDLHSRFYEDAELLCFNRNRLFGMADSLAREIALLLQEEACR